MLKKISTSLFLIIYFSVSAVSFADEVALEILSETSPEVEAVIINIPEEITSEEPLFEEGVIPPTVSGDVIVPVIDYTSAPSESPLLVEEAIDTPQDTQEKNIESPLTTDPEQAQEAAVGDILTTEIPAVVEVEESGIFIPPTPEPESWQPAVFEDPTTESNTLVGNTETQSDSVFLAENSVFVRRMVEQVVIDSTAKHSCKVDVFRTDVSETTTSTLSVKFYGISTFATYDAEIGSLPNGIDVRFAKNNDYIYDFRGKETILELIVNNQDDSLTGNFTIPIIYTQKGKKESIVICQLNIVNEKEEIVVPIVPIVPVDPVQEVMQEILNIITPNPEMELPIEVQSPIVIEEVFDTLVPEIPLSIPPVYVPPIVLPEQEKSEIGPLTDSVLSEPLNDTVTTIIEPEVLDPVITESTTILNPDAEIVTSPLKNVPIPDPTSILSSDVSST